MMQAVARKSRAINRVEKRNQGLYLYQETGTIRILPQTDFVIRVSYTEESTFSDVQGSEFCDLSGTVVWNYEEENGNIRIETAKLTVVVQRKTGSISYYRKDGILLLAEEEKESKQVEAFEVYQTQVDEHTQIKEIQTPDGMKRAIGMAKKVYDRTRYHTRLFLTFDEEEALYGLGQSEYGAFNLRHTTQYLHQANLKIAIPMLVSTKGYGILLSTQGACVFHDTREGSYFYTEADEMLDYYFLGGNDLDGVIKGFRVISGKASMLPRWAFGYIQSRERYETQEQILEIAAEFRKRKIGLDAIVLDWMSWEEGMWGQKTPDCKRFPDPKEMIKTLHQNKVHFMVSIWPNMVKESQNYKEMEEAGKIFPGSDVYDAFDEEARKLYWKQVSEGWYQYGVDAWWCDSSEGFAPEWSCLTKPQGFQMYQTFVEEAGRFMPLEKVNAYGLYHARGIYEGQREQERDKRVLNLTRSGYPGSQKYGTVLWSGDISASFETLRNQIAAGLNFCASGMPYWTLDIGAFFVKRGLPWYWDGDYEKAESDRGYRELYTRWYQFGAFLPMFRSHGTDCYREPWNFGEPGEEYYDAIVRANQLRYRLMPYIYSLAGAVWKNDSTMIRLLAFDFAKDTKVYSIQDQFLFGPFLMICPVTEANATKRSVYLPDNTQWYDFWTNKKYEGGQTISVSLTLDKIPIFVKAGAIVPMIESTEHVQTTKDWHVVVQVYPGADGSFALYEDAGDGYEYEEGAYTITQLEYHDLTKQVVHHIEGDSRFVYKELSVVIVEEQA